MKFLILALISLSAAVTQAIDLNTCVGGAGSVLICDGLICNQSAGTITCSDGTICNSSFNGNMICSDGTICYWMTNHYVCI